MIYNLNKVYGNEIPPEFQFLQGGTFINLLPKTLEENLVEYYQCFTTETNEDKLEKLFNVLTIKIHKDYLEDTKWYIDRLNDPSSGKAVPAEVLTKRAFAREEINRCEEALNIGSEE